MKISADLADADPGAAKSFGRNVYFRRQLTSISQLNAQTLGELSDAIEKSAIHGPELEPERQNFVSLILENPNYFGNLEGSVFKPVKPMKGNPSYEELACVGLQTQLDRLEAVINIKRTAGYGGTICQAGSFDSSGSSSICTTTESSPTSDLPV